MRGVKFLQWGFVYEVNCNYTDETARRRVFPLPCSLLVTHSLPQECSNGIFA